MREFGLRILNERMFASFERGEFDGKGRGFVKGFDEINVTLLWLGGTVTDKVDNHRLVDAGRNTQEVVDHSGRRRL